MKIGNKEFDLKNHVYVMGILNVTPDSFSDGGRWNSLDAALIHTEEMIADGADIIDLGGESTRPGHIQITEQEEIDRVIPYIEALKTRFDVPVSIDTYKGTVAEAALAAGADLLNDIWGLKYDNKIAEVAGKYNRPCCRMHNRNTTEYNDLMEDVLNDLRESAGIALAHGVSEDNIILDPGIGFGKTYVQNLEVMNRLERLQELGYPVLLGTSRKSMIGLTLDLPADQRVEGTVATSVIGVMKGCAFVRVHDVKENVRAIRMTEAILHA